MNVEPFHLFRYLDEQAFRFNERKNEDGDKGRFILALEGVVGKGAGGKHAKRDRKGRRTRAGSGVKSAYNGLLDQVNHGQSGILMPMQRTPKAFGVADLLSR